MAVENDANALAVGEKHFGAAKSLRDFVCMTLGTGLGGGCYVGRRLNRGTHYIANMLGHIPLVPGGEPCSCGVRGCLEPYVNAAALVRYAGDSQISAAQVIAAANAGDERAVAWLKSTFPEEEIRRAILSERRLSARSANFWALAYGIPLNEVAALKPAR